MASQSNMYFSHRVLFFLESLDSKDIQINDEIQGILISLCHTFKNDSPNLYEASHDIVTKSEMQLAIETYKKLEMLPDEKLKLQKYKIMASDISLPKYDFTMGVKTPLVNDHGYLSTPFFVFSLTNLGARLLQSHNKEEALFEGLQNINMHLPAAVYVPFVNGSMRNYVVLHIKVMEAKIFVTKERAPYLICLEVFRPEEAKFKDKIKDLDKSESDSENDDSENGKS